MTFVKTCGVAGCLLAIASVAVAQPLPSSPDPAAPTKPLPPALKPHRILGTGITVVDLEKETAFYVNVLGMVVVRQVNPREVALGYASPPGQAASLVLLKGTPKVGSTTYGRMILDVPDAAALAAHMTSIGYPARKVGQPTDKAYFVADPERNFVELYTPN